MPEPEAPDPAQARIAALEAELALARKALNESRSRYRLIVNSIVDYAIIATDLDGRITLWTESASTLFGWSEQAMIGRSIEEIFTEADILAKVPSAAMRAALASSSTRQERWHRRADGMHFFASGEVMVLRDDSDALAGFLHILRDRTEERRIQHELEASRERLDYALNSSALVGTWDWDVVNDLVYADDKFRDFFGLPTSAATGPLPIERFLDGVHPEDRETARTRIMAAKISGQPFTLEYRTIDRMGDVHWVSAQGRCFHDALGDPIRFPGAIIDITQEKRRRNMQAALLRLGDEGVEQLGDSIDYSVRSLAIIGETLELGQVGYAAITDDGQYFAVTAQWTDGVSPAIPPHGKIGRIERRLVDRLTQDGTLVVEDVHLHPATRENMEFWQGLSVAAMINMAVVEDGRVRIILFLFSSRPRNWDEEELAFVRDILNRAWTYSRRRLAERRLIETETRLRLAQEAADIGTLDYRPLSGAFDMDERCRAIFGVAGTAEPIFPDDLLGSIAPEDCPVLRVQVEKALGSGTESLLDLQFRTFNRVDGGIRHIRLEAQTVAEEGRVVRFVGAVHDVTEERTAQDRQALMTRELRHRVKNTLAMVEALAGLTMRRAATPREGLAAFVARLAALREAHEILTTTSWTSAPLRAVVDRIMAGRDATKAKRIRYGGPDVHLSARQSLALSLTLFEMLSNAMRYGSLSGGTGTVDLGWSVSMTPSGPHLRMIWKERGGPTVQPPRRFGLGLKLIRQSLPVEIGGTVDLTFPPDGASLVIEAPVHLGPDEAENRGDGPPRDAAERP